MAVGVDVAGEDDGGGSAMNGATAPGVGGDCGVAGKGRRDAAVTAVVTAVAEGDGGARGEAADLAGGGGYAGAGGGGSREGEGVGAELFKSGGE